MNSESGFAMAELTAGQLNALVKKVGGKERVLEILRGEAEIVVKQPDLLCRVTTVEVPGTAKFVAKSRLKAANVGWTDDNFNQLFRDKVEEQVSDATLVVSRLEKGSLDAPILAELGDRAETQLAHMFALLEKQNKGEQGVLLTNGYANIFYIRGTDGNLWAVGAVWGSGGGCWGVGAYSVESPGRWNVGCQVFSRDS